MTWRQYCTHYEVFGPRYSDTSSASVECLECGQSLKHVSQSHLKRCSGLTMGEYRAKWPDAKLVAFQAYKRLPGPPAKKTSGWVEENRGFATPCWIWQLYVTKRGYGQAMRSGKRYAAHRYVYGLHGGVIPDGMELHHRCEVPLCVNPAHLEPVDEHTHKVKHRRLTPDQVREARRLWASGQYTTRQLSERFGLSRSAFDEMKAGRSYCDVS